MIPSIDCLSNDLNVPDITISSEMLSTDGMAPYKITVLWIPTIAPVESLYVSIWWGWQCMDTSHAYPALG